PMAKSRLPSGLGVGPMNLMGPKVSCAGSGGLRRKKSDRSSRTQILVTPSRVAWNTKYFASGVQRPQQVSDHPDELGNKACGLAPSAEISHNPPESFFVS